MKNSSLTIFIALLLILSGCSFSGSFKSAQAPDHIKTFFVENFYNETPNGPPTLTLTFTEKTKEYFQRNSKFELVNGLGNAELQGTITQYNVTPIAPVSGGTNIEIASQNRLTIGVSIRYTDNIKDENSFTKNFSKFSDFERTENLSDVEDQLVNEIADLLIIDIFNAAYDNW